MPNLDSLDEYLLNAILREVMAVKEYPRARSFDVTDKDQRKTVTDKVKCEMNMWSNGVVKRSLVKFIDRRPYRAIN